MDEIAMQNLKKLLEYQKKDIELHIINDKLDKDEALKIKESNEQLYYDVIQQLNKIEEQSHDLIDAVSELEKYVNDNEALFTEYENASVEETEEALAERVRKLESIKGKFQNAERKAHDMNDKANNIRRDRNDAVKKGNNAMQLRNDANAKHKALVASKANEINKLKSELAEMAQHLDKGFFDEYKRIDAEHKFPPIALARGDAKNGFNCGICGIALPQQGNSLLKENGWCHCDNCRRIIVKI